MLDCIVVDLLRRPLQVVPQVVHLHADTIALTQGDRAIVEFTLPERGRYMFHPHQHRLADLGAMGWFAAV